MANNIKHLGIVENINGIHVKVRILQASACAACSVKGHCSVSETKEKVIDVSNVNSVSCQVGDRVMIVGTTNTGVKAVVLAFVLPFLVMLSVLVVSLQVLEGSEWLSALLALGSLIPYYLLVFLFRKKISKLFVFRLESLQNNS